MSLLNKVDKLHNAKPWLGEIPLTSRYSAGIAGEKFFSTIRDEGRFLGTRCPKCELIYVPATMFCERCFTELEEWVDVASKGTLFTFTVLYKDLDEKPLEEPLILAYIKLNGSDGGLIHYVSGVDLDDLYIGMEVEAVFKDKKERKGSILDVVYFKPT
jgi:uncharacterized protein